MRLKTPIRSFVVCHMPGAASAVRRLALTDSAQDKITQMIEGQLDYLLADDLKKIAFDPTYVTDDESVLWVRDFDLPEHIEDALAVPQEVPNYTTKERIDRIKALFYVDTDNNLVFQCWRNFEILSRRKLWFLLNGETFDAEAETKVPLILEPRIDAVYWEGDLYFKSYANTSAMLDMLNYVSEATSEDIEAFAAIEIFECNAKELNERCSSLQRKHIRLLVQSGVLKDKKVQFFYDKACEVQYELPLNEKQRIILPPKRRELTTLLKFLSDRIYKGLISDEILMAGSATKMDSAS